MSINAIVTQEAEINFLSELITTLLDGCNCHLFSNNITVSPATVLTDFVECTFAGYAESAFTAWSSPAIDGDGAAASTPSNAAFTPTSGGGSGTIYGGYVTDPGDSELLWTWNYPTGGITVAIGITLYVSPNFTVLSRF